MTLSEKQTIFITFRGLEKDANKLKELHENDPSDVTVYRMWREAISAKLAVKNLLSNLNIEDEYFQNGCGF